MNRKKIEEGLILSFHEMVKDNGLELVKKKFISDHYADFEFFINDLKYKLTIVFIKPNYIKAICYLKITSKIVTSLYNSINNNNQIEDFELVNININSYLVPENSSGIYQTSDTVEFCIDKKPLESNDDLTKIAKEYFFNEVYQVILNDIIPKTNSLEKIDYLFNSLPFINNDEDKPKWIMYSTFLPEQTLSGTLLAITLKRTDRIKLFDKYLKYASKFEDGKKESIDIMRKAIKIHS